MYIIHSFFGQAERQAHYRGDLPPSSRLYHPVPPILRKAELTLPA